jgi:hypothetical protein
MRVKKIETIKLENKAMQLRRDEIAKEDRELLVKISKNIKLIEKWTKICEK